jgi:predicted DNA-binding transcriptional regulator YafY
MSLSNKSRILYILQILYKYTDEENTISITEIIDLLEKQGIVAHRRTIMTDIESIAESGVDIITIKSTQNRYFIGNRDFEFAEVKLLVDAVESSKLITQKKSNELIRKLSTLVSKHQASELNSHVYVDQRIKPENEEIYYTVDAIHSAINCNKQIEFKYYQYTGKKEKIFKNSGSVYILSPYALIWSEDHYYAIGFNKKHGKISKFRVDRMAQTTVTAIDSIPKPVKFDVAQYAKSVFEMFDGDTKSVELKCTNDLMDVIVDRFGENVNTMELGSNCFKAIVDISISPTFYGWVFGFGSKMSILAPAEVKGEFIEMARSVAQD